MGTMRTNYQAGNQRLHLAVNTTNGAVNTLQDTVAALDANPPYATGVEMSMPQSQVANGSFSVSNSTGYATIWKARQSMTVKRLITLALYGSTGSGNNPNCTYSRVGLYSISFARSLNPVAQVYDRGSVSGTLIAQTATSTTRWNNYVGIVADSVAADGSGTAISSVNITKGNYYAIGVVNTNDGTKNASLAGVSIDGALNQFLGLDGMTYNLGAQSTLPATFTSSSSHYVRLWAACSI